MDSLFFVLPIPISRFCAGGSIFLQKARAFALASIVAELNRCGAGDRTRTGGSLLGKQVLYQLSYSRSDAPKYNIRQLICQSAWGHQHGGCKVRVHRSLPVRRVAEATGCVYEACYSNPTQVVKRSRAFRRPYPAKASTPRNNSNRIAIKQARLAREGGLRTRSSQLQPPGVGAWRLCNRHALGAKQRLRLCLATRGGASGGCAPAYGVCGVGVLPIDQRQVPVVTADVADRRVARIGD